jgi:hypothetical protein
MLRAVKAALRMFRKLWMLLRSSLRPKSSSLPGDRLLRVPINSPEVLDRLWKEFIKTGKEAAVLRIVSVLDWDDLVRRRLESWLSTIHPETWATPPYMHYQQLFIRCCFPIKYDQRAIDGPVDLDLHVALLARSHELKFADLPIPLSPKELVRLATKWAALWSLLSMAKQHDAIARLCERESKEPGGAARLHLGKVVASLNDGGELMARTAG